VYRAVASPTGGPEDMDSSCKHGRRLRVLENRVLRRIFGARKDDVTGGCTENYEGWNFNSGNYLFTTDTK